MPPKTIRTDANGNAIKEPTRKTAKPKLHSESLFSVKLRMDREKHFLQTETDPDRHNEIEAYILALEMQLHGFNSATTAKVVAVQENKLKTASRFQEDNDVAAWGKWFKEQYPGVPYTIDKVAQRRSRISGAIHKASAYQSGNPDIFIQSPKAGFSGAYIEQKRDASIFYKGTKILKPGNDNHNIWQSLYHADLRAQGYWVMFSISLEATKKITERYMSGNPYTMQVFEYYCKPEDYKIFEGNKNFKPCILKNV